LGVTQLRADDPELRAERPEGKKERKAARNNVEGEKKKPGEDGSEIM